MSISKEEALALAESIAKIIEGAKQWCKITHDNRPDLKQIIIEASIKID